MTVSSGMTPEGRSYASRTYEPDGNAGSYDVTVTAPFKLGNGPKPDSESSVS